jgi:hypothetical protein
MMLKVLNDAASPAFRDALVDTTIRLRAPIISMASLGNIATPKTKLDIQLLARSMIG